MSNILISMVGMTLRARMDFKIQSYQGEINAKQSRMPKPKNQNYRQFLDTVLVQ